MANVSDWRLAALGLAALLLAGWSGWSRPLPSPSVGLAQRPPAWTAIEWKPSDSAADAKLLAQRNTWGWSQARPAAPLPPGAVAPPQVAAAPPAPVGPWRIVGTADWGQGPAAIIQTQPPGTPKPQFIFRRAGEALPDGRVVVRVEPARVEARRPDSGEQSAIRLFVPQR
jgi:hypothetical protein